MPGPTRPLHPLPLSAILAIAGACSTLCVLAIPTASPTTQRAPVTQAVDQDQIHRDATANLRAIGAEASAVFSVVEMVAQTAVN